MTTHEDNKTINGHKYYVRQLPPTKALPLKFKLTKILGAALPSLMSIKDNPAINKNEKHNNDFKEAEAFGNALESLFNVTDPIALMELIKSVVETATRDGQRIMDNGGDQAITFDDAFQNEYKEMYQVFFFVLKVNFGNFINGFGLNIEKLLKEKVASIQKT